MNERGKERDLMNSLMKSVLSVLIVFFALPAAAQTFSVVHKKALWPDGAGELIFSEDAIEFRATG
jgi:hypothetical protein